MLLKFLYEKKIKWNSVVKALNWQNKSCYETLSSTDCSLERHWEQSHRLKMPGKIFKTFVRNVNSSIRIPSICLGTGKRIFSFALMVSFFIFFPSNSFVRP